MVLSIILLAAGIVIALAGFKLFRLLLPLIGLVGGAMAGFIGFQSVFGKGAVSTSVAIFVAMAVGIVLALLSYFFFEIALIIYAALVGASLFTYLGMVLGLENNGFVLFLLGVGGFVVGANFASRSGFSVDLVLLLTSFVGIAFILASIFLMAGSVSVSELNDNGIISTVLSKVDQSFLWLFVWIAGSMVALTAQKRTLMLEVMGNQYEYETKRTKK